MSSEKKPNKLGYRFVRTLFTPLIYFLWPTKVIGRENMVFGSRAIYAANHYSALDIVPIAAKLFKKDITVVMKEEAYSKAEWFFDIIGCIPIKRGEGDIKAYKEILKVLNADRPLVIFPEGKRNPVFDSPKLQEFKSGAVTFALRTEAPIVPILIYRSTKIFRKNYLVIGEPVSYEKHYGQKSAELADELTLELMSKFDDLRRGFENGSCEKRRLLLRRKAGN